MLTARHATLLSLALLAGACGTRSDRSATVPDDLQRDLAAAAASSGDFAGTPQRYQPMRFVSSVERAHTATKAKRTVLAHHRTRPAPVRRPAAGTLTERAPDPTETAVAEAPAAMAAPESATPEPAVVRQPTSEPTNAPSDVSHGSGGEAGGGDHGRGGGWGGLIGTIGIAVIRGGIGTVDKCDPRTDGRARIPVIDRPVFGMPVPTGQPTFPRMPRRELASLEGRKPTR